MYKIIYFSSDYSFPDNVNPQDQEQLREYYNLNKKAILKGAHGDVDVYDSMQELVLAFNSEAISDLGHLLTVDAEFSNSEEIAALFQDMIVRAKELIYTEEFKRSEEYRTQETDLKTLGILVSKFCKWDIGDIGTVYDAALEDSNANPVEEARELLRMHGYVVDGLWSKEDIKQQAEEMDIELTPEQVDNIFSKMGKFDAELGINWDFIKNLIQEEVNPIDHSITIEP